MDEADERNEKAGDDEGSLGRRLMGTEERPTRLRKAWWILKEVSFLPWS